MFVDSHCHLDFPELIADLDGVLARAQIANVLQMVTICTRMSNEPTIRALAETHQSVYYAAGAHPLHVHEEALPSLENLIEAAKHPKFVGIGETGLDYHYETAPRAMQWESFRTHIHAARQTGLPLIVHTRDADVDTQALLQEEYQEAPFTGILHCFTAGQALAESALEMGLYLSMSGVVTFKNAQDLRDRFAQMPLERILIETDSPYLAPVPKRGKRNEPAFVAHTAAIGAEIMGVSLETFAAATTDNFHRVFSKVPKLSEKTKKTP